MILAPATQEISDPKKRHAFLLNSFLSNRNPSTIKNYKAALTDFQHFIGSGSPEEAIARLFSKGHGEANALVLAYRDRLVQQKLAPNTINVRLAAIKSMGKLARLLGMIPWIVEVEGLKVQTYRNTKGVGKETVVEAIKKLEKETDKISIRDLVIIRMLYTHGLRRKEVAGLDLSDLDLEKSRVWILGKDRLEKEEITLAPKTKAAIEAWLRIRGRDKGPLIYNFDPTHKGDLRLSGTSIYRSIRGYGLGRPHGLRHSGITEALDKTGGDVRAVQKFSRHKKIETLMIYDDNRRDLGGEVAKKLDEDT